MNRVELGPATGAQRSAGTDAAQTRPITPLAGPEIHPEGSQQPAVSARRAAMKAGLDVPWPQSWILGGRQFARVCGISLLSATAAGYVVRAAGAVSSSLRGVEAGPMLSDKTLSGIGLALTTAGAAGLWKFAEHADRAQVRLDLEKEHPGLSDGAAELLGPLHKDVPRFRAVAMVLKQITDGTLTPELDYTDAGRSVLQECGVHVAKVQSQLKTLMSGHVEFFPELQARLAPTTDRETDPVLLLARMMMGQVTDTGAFTAVGVQTMRGHGCDVRFINALEQSQVALVKQYPELFPKTVRPQAAATAQRDEFDYPPEGCDSRAVVDSKIDRLRKIRKQALAVIVVANQARVKLGGSELARVLGTNTATTQGLVHFLRGERLITAQLGPQGREVAESVDEHELRGLLDDTQRDRLGLFLDRNRARP